MAEENRSDDRLSHSFQHRDTNVEGEGERIKRSTLLALKSGPLGICTLKYKGGCSIKQHKHVKLTPAQRLPVAHRQHEISRGSCKICCAFTIQLTPQPPSSLLVASLRGPPQHVLSPLGHPDSHEPYPSIGPKNNERTINQTIPAIKQASCVRISL